MPPKRTSQYNLITSDDSDIPYSDDQIEKIQQQKSNNINRPKQDLYEKFISSEYFHITRSLKMDMKQIFKFLQQRKNIMFIFGPSGCGKTSLVKKILSMYKINYSIIKQHQIEEQQSYQGYSIMSLQQSILQAMRQTNSTQIKICFDFPIFLQNYQANSIKQFKNTFKTQIMRTNQKIIFILNEQLYSSYSILNQNQNNQLNLLKCQKVTVLKIPKYGKNQMKKLLKSWILETNLYEFSEFIHDKNHIQEILQLSNGDMRKAMHIIYWKSLQKKSNILNKNKIKQIQKLSKTNNIIKLANNNDHNNKLQLQQQYEQHKYNKSRYWNKLKDYEQIPKQKMYEKITLYHGLGKLLYGKRLNQKNHHKKGKNQISRYYTQKQINQLDPPFYFDPVSIFENLKVPLQIFTRLLQQNYIQRYGKIQDIRKMSNIFKIYDYLFSSRNSFQDQQVNNIRIKLITWGILIYNKNSKIDNRGLQKIQRSQYTNIDKIIKQKKKLIKQYFPQNKLLDQLKYAHFTRNILPNQMLNKIIFTNNKNKNNQVNVDTHMIKQQDQQYEIQNQQKLSKKKLQFELNQMVKNQLKKIQQRQQLIKMFDQDELSDDISISSEQSDIYQ